MFHNWPRRQLSQGNGLVLWVLKIAITSEAAVPRFRLRWRVRLIVRRLPERDAPRLQMDLIITIAVFVVQLLWTSGPSEREDGPDSNNRLRNS